MLVGGVYLFIKGDLNLIIVGCAFCFNEDLWLLFILTHIPIIVLVLDVLISHI